MSVVVEVANGSDEVVGELVEAIRHTPSLPAAEVERLIADRSDIVVLDSRRFEKYRTMSIPTGTGVPGGDLANHLQGDYVSVYVPTTPNPTSGFLIFVPAAKVVELEMHVSDGMKMIISGGTVLPPGTGPKA